MTMHPATAAHHPPGPLLLVNSANTGNTVLRRLARTSLVRLYPGQYTELSAWLEASARARYELQLEALRHHSNPVFCCESALTVHGIATFGVPRRITTLAHGGRHGLQSETQHLVNGAAVSLPGFVPHVRHRHEGISQLTTSWASSVPAAHAGAQILLRAPLTHALTVSDGAARSGEWAQAAVAAEIRTSRPGPRRNRALLRLEAGRAGAQSPAESGSRAVILGAGFPEPELQHRFEDELGFVAQVDAWWDHLRLVGEVDGEVKYTNPAMTNGRGPLDVLRDEKRRENRLLAQGIQLRRWGWAEIVHPERLIALLGAAGLRADSRAVQH